MFSLKSKFRIKILNLINVKRIPITFVLQSKFGRILSRGAELEKEKGEGTLPQVMGATDRFSVGK